MTWHAVYSKQGGEGGVDRKSNQGRPRRRSGKFCDGQNRSFKFTAEKLALDACVAGERLEQLRHKTENVFCEDSGEGGRAYVPNSAPREKKQVVLQRCKVVLAHWRSEESPTTSGEMAWQSRQSTRRHKKSAFHSPVAAWRRTWHARE